MPIQPLSSPSSTPQPTDLIPFDPLPAVFDPSFCGETKFIPVEDEFLKMSYQVPVTCGTPQGLAIQRFRQSLWNQQAQEAGPPAPAPAPRSLLPGVSSLFMELLPISISVLLGRTDGLLFRFFPPIS